MVAGTSRKFSKFEEYHLLNKVAFALDGLIPPPTFPAAVGRVKQHTEFRKVRMNLH